MKIKSIESLIPDDSWLKRWMECWPLNEAPRSFILLTGLSALGAALGRNAWMELDYRKIYPMLNLLVAGPSGLGKTEAITLAEQFLLKSPYTGGARVPDLINGETTYQALHSRLATNSHAIVVAEEMAAFFVRADYSKDMIPFVTKLLNYQNEIPRETQKGGLVMVTNPEVTFICGTTVDWLQKQLPNTAVGGGFLPRFLIVFETDKSKFIPLPDLHLTVARRAALHTLRTNTAVAFWELVNRSDGIVKFKDTEAMNEFEIWLTNHKPASGHLAPFSARAREFVLRLSMLLALSCQRREITYKDVQAASGIYEWAMERLQEVVVPFSPEGELQNKVLGLFETAGTILSEREVKRAMRNYMRADNTIRYIDSLLQSGDLKRTPDQKLQRTK